MIESSLDLLGSIQNSINRIDADLRKRISTMLNDLKIAMSIPGIEFTSAVTILAE